MQSTSFVRKQKTACSSNLWSKKWERNTWDFCFIPKFVSCRNANAPISCIDLKMTKIFLRENKNNHHLYSPVALQLRAPPKVSARAPAHRSYHFRGVKLKSCVKKIHHNLYISKQANVRIKHADTEGASHKKFGTDARVQ